jgi:hypothetical protein
MQKHKKKTKKKKKSKGDRTNAEDNEERSDEQIYDHQARDEVPLRPTHDGTDTIFCRSAAVGRDVLEDGGPGLLNAQTSLCAPPPHLMRIGALMQLLMTEVFTACKGKL